MLELNLALDQLAASAVTRRLSAWRAARSASTWAPRRASARPSRCSTRVSGARERGTDVVVGFVETHGRAEHRRRRSATSRSCRASTIDVPRARRSRRWTSTRSSPASPSVALVDELAHTNVPGLAQREALAGRRRAARRRHRRDLDRQRAAPRVDERRRRADHRDQAAGDDPRRGRAGGRPDRARRHDARGAAAAHGARQHLPGREGRRLARQLLPRRATSARCASSR